MTTNNHAKNETKKVAGEAEALKAIAKMPAPWSAMCKQLHKIITASAPELKPKTWYGMPAYTKDDKIICFFRGGDKFKERYMTLGFNDPAHLDDGNFWPIAYAVTKLTAVEEKKITALVKKAIGLVPHLN
jgi:uncharacterized protein YdhG (YjbR/CyaY superfamily)